MWNRVHLFACVIALLFIVNSCRAEQWDPEEEGKINWRKQGAYFVKFYAPWCGHCKLLEPVWLQFAQEVQDLKMDFKVVDIDCTTDTISCGKANIRAYPTLQFYYDGEVTEYTGRRNVESLLSFVRDKFPSLTKKSHKPSHSFVKKKERSPLKPKVEETTASIELTDKNFASLVDESNEKWLIQFYAPWCGHCKRLKPTWTELAKHAEAEGGKYKVGHVDCTKNIETASEYMIESFPTILLFTPDADTPEQYKGDREVDRLHKFAMSPAERARGASIAEEIDGVFQLSANNMKTAIKEGMWFVKFYAPWCGHCTSLKPVFEAVAAKVTGVNFADLDCDSDDNKNLCQEEQITGFPTVKLYNNGEYIATYDEEREVKSMTKWLREEQADINSA